MAQYDGDRTTETVHQDSEAISIEDENVLWVHVGGLEWETYMNDEWTSVVVFNDEGDVTDG